MIYEIDSFERYKEGEKLVKKYQPIYVWGSVLMVVFGFIGAIVAIKYINSIFIPIIFVCIPFLPAIYASFKATKGKILMREAIETYGVDEEEYEGRI